MSSFLYNKVDTLFANQIVPIMFLKYHKFLQEVPQVPEVPNVSKLVWQQRITLVTFLYKTITDLPNNIEMTPTGEIFVLHLLNPLTKL
jgi:hypothetical protein